MKYRLVRFTQEWAAAARRCNERLHASGVAPFLLPSGENHPLDERQLVRRQHWLVAGEDGEVHGGCLLQIQPGWLAGRDIEAVNIQSPLSEGIADSRHAGLAVWMMKEVQARFPFLYSIGMGSDQAPFPRLLKALRWRVELAPFYFRVLAGRRLLAHVAPLRRHPRFGWAVRAGAFVPLLPDLAFSILHKLRSKPPSTAAPASTTDWLAVRSRYGFGIDRSEPMLSALYGDASRFQRVSIPGGFAIVCWSERRNDPYFGDLRLATLVDAICESGTAFRLMEAVTTAARKRGADLLVTNQTAPDILEAVQQSGWLTHSSNFVVALSPTLTAEVGSAPVFITRGDGDGLGHL